MARRRGSAGPEVSLFPFLSILACLIGALTILIVALSVSQVLQGREDESVARAEDYVKLEKELEDLAMEIERQEEELKRTNAAAVELAQLRPKIEQIKTQVEKLKEVTDKEVPLIREVAELEKEKERIEEEKAKVEAGLAAGKEKLGELAKQLGKGLPLKILSTSEYFRRRSPVFVEVRKDALVVHSPSRQVTIPKAAIKTNADYKKTVDYVAAKKDRIIVFLVRDDGRGTFYPAQDFARANGAVTSKVPLQGQGDVDLKEFFKKR